MTQRRLAAIMFTDIVGYTALMGSDEDKAFKVLRKNREIHQSLIDKYNGKWLKEMGDGSMAQFKSALDAVNCAIEIQDKAKVEIEAQLRIGIHLGDITHENGEIYGDGVNVASRIESIAEPGSIFFSEAIYGAVKGASYIHTQFRGERKLKNVKGPVRVYKIMAEDATESQSYKSLIKILIPAVIVIIALIFGVWKLAGLKSGRSEKTILVLPFELVEPDSSNQYLVNSINQELIRNLGKVKALIVINPATSTKFEASDNPINDARQQLGKTDYFVNGSIDIESNRITIDLNVYDDQKIKVWSNNYNEDLARIPELTGKVAIGISEAIKVKIKEDEYGRIIRLDPIDPEIFKLWVKAFNELDIGNDESFTKARIYLNEAVDKSPADARTWAVLAEALVKMGLSDNPPTGVWQEAQGAAFRALQLDSLNAEAWAALAQYKTYHEWDYGGAGFGYKKANDLNSSIAKNHFHYARYLYLHDRLDEAIEENIRARELDPLQPDYTNWLTILFIQKGDYEKAMHEITRACKITGDSMAYYQTIGRLYMHREQYDSAIYVYEKASNTMELGISYFRKGDMDKGMEILQRVLSFPINPWQAWIRAHLYAEIDSLDAFFEYANYEPPIFAAPWYRKTIANPKVIQDPRYKQLMDKMNLPMPEGY